MLESRHLSFRYTATAPAFRFPDLRVAEGNACLLLGPSGGGKSTCLHLLAGVLTPETGETVLNGTNYAALRGAELDRFRGRNIGLVFQRAYFLEALTVRENLAIARRTAGLPSDPAILTATLDKLGIGQYADTLPGRLSVGEQQRVTIARALVNRPTLILADEPTSALDRANAARVSQILRDRAAELGAILVVVTHDDRLRKDFSHLVEIGPAIPATDRL